MKNSTALLSARSPLSFPRSLFAYGCARLSLLVLALLFAVLAGRALADYTVVDAGGNRTFSAALPSASSYLWFLDGAAVGANASSWTYAPDLRDAGTHWVQARVTQTDNSTSTLEWGVRVRIPVPASTVKYYVSPSGSDSNSGNTPDKPFQTLEKARDTIRTLTSSGTQVPAGGVTVYLRGGTHWRTTTFSLTSSDSGSASAPIIYTAYPGEIPVVSTGKPLASSAFSPLAASEQSRVAPGVPVGRIWETDAAGFTNKGPYPLKYSSWPVRNTSDASSASLPDVFYNSGRAWLSRYPNHNLSEEYLTPNLKMDGIAVDSTGTNYLNTNGTYTNSSNMTVAVGGAFTYNATDADHFARWKTALAHGGVWLQGYWRVTWQSDIAQVLDIDTTKKVLEFAPNSFPQGGFGNKYSSTPGFTGRPGSKSEPFWAINLLEEIDQPGEWCLDFSRNKLYFLMDADGAPPDGSVVVADFPGPVVQMTGTSNVIFQSLRFEKSLGVAIQMVGGSRNLLAGCTFRNLTNMAVSIQGGSTNGVVSCDFSELGAMGIQITAAVGGTSSSPDQSNFVSNNKMSGLSRYAQVYQPGVSVVSPAVGNRVAHNVITDTPQMGVYFNGYRNLYEYNEVSKYGTLVDDTGSFYSYEDAAGDDTFRYNYSHDTPLANAITYDGTNRIVTGRYYGNISLLSAACEGESIGLFLCGAVDCTNNISIGGGRYSSFGFTTDVQRNINNNAAVAGYYPTLDFVWKQVTTLVGSNISSGTTVNATVLANGPNLSYGNGTSVGFLDFNARDFRLRPDAQIFSDMPDFQPIPFEMIGLYNDEYRSDVATHAPYILSLPATPAPGASFTANGDLCYPQFDAGTSVKVYYGTVDGGTNAGSWQNVLDLGSLSAGPVSAALSGLGTSSTYYYRFFASNAAGSAWASNSTVVLPPPASAPTGLSALSGNGSVVLAWGAVPNATTYNVKRSTASGSGYATIASVSGTAFTDSSASNGTTYYYVVSAASSIAETANSAEVAATPLKIPAGWASQDLGSVAFAGSSSVTPYGNYTVAGSGGDIWNSADAFQFAGRAWQGDGVLIARILDFTNTNSFTKVGVMFRETLLANSKNSFAGAVGQSKTVMQIRTATGGTSANSGNTTSGALPRWIKLVRSGNTFTAYQSGTTSPSWVQLGNNATVTMNATCYAGLAVSSHDNTKLCTAHFDNVIFLAKPDAVTGMGNVTLTWLPSTGADSYLVQRSTVSGGNYTTVATLPIGTTSYIDSGLTNGSTYYYVVTATGDQGMSATSPQVAAQPGVLNSPSGLVGTAGYSQATLSWSAATGAVSYNVKRSTTSGSGYVTVASNISGTSYLDSNVTTGTTYYYVVSALSSWGAESANSAEVGVGVGPLQNTGFESPVLASGNYSYNTLNGSWTFAVQSGTNGSGISSNNSSFTKNNTVSPQGQQVAFLQGNGSISQLVRGLIPGANYTITFAASERHNTNGSTQNQTFQLKMDSTVLQTFASGASGTGNTTLSTGTGYTDYSLSFLAANATQTLTFLGTNKNGGDNTVFLDNVRIVLLAPTTPTGLTVSSDFGQPTLNWTPVAGAAGYNVKRSTSKNSGYTVIATGLAATSFSDSVDSTSTMYFYKVSAVNPTGESPDSAPSAAPLISPPGPVVAKEATGPTGATVSYSTTAIDLNGSAVPTSDSPTSGTLFPLGDNPVVTSAADAAGNNATLSFTVRVQDTTVPLLNTQNMTVQATGSGGAFVDFTPDVVSANDAVDGPVSVICSPVSGSQFPLGPNAVSANATDAAGNTATGTFWVTVVDTTPPTINVPGDMFVDATSSSGAAVSFPASAFDLVSGSVPVNPSISSNSTFPIGTTKVDVSATDGQGNMATKSFNVTVLPLPTQKADNNLALSQGASWTGGKVLGTTDTALWSGNYSSANASASIGAGLTVERVRIASVSRAISIPASTGSLNLAGLSGTGIDMNGATQDLSIAAPVVLGSGAIQSWTVNASRTLTVSGAISESVTGSGIVANGNGTIVLSGNNTFTGGLFIAPPAGGLPTYKFGGNNPAGYVKVTGGAVGAVSANGRLDVAGAATFGPISGSNSAGLISLSTSSNPVLAFQGNSSFSMFFLGADGSKATLQQTGNGSVTFAIFGYSASNNSANSSVTFSGGVWNIGQTGQGNTNAQMTGTATLANGATVTQTSNSTYTHGNWVIGNGSLTLQGGTVQHTDGKPSNMSFTVGGGNATAGLTIPDGGLVLGNNNAAPLSLADSLSIGNGGSVIIGSVTAGNLTLGTTNNQTAETDTVSLGGGELLVNGAILASSGTGQTRVFNWTGGQLSVSAVSPGANFSASSGVSGGITPSSLNQTAGVLAPGDAGVAGKTLVTGSYSLGANGTLDIDIGGTTQATGFQTGSYDYLSVNGTVTLGGNLSVRLISSGNATFVPAGNGSAGNFTVLSANGTLSGNFTNAPFGQRVATVGGEGSFVVNKSGNAVVLNGYLALLPAGNLQAVSANGTVALSWSAPANAPSGTTYTVSRSGTPGGPYATISSGVVGLGFSESAPVLGSGNYYVVSAVYGGVKTSPSNEASVTNYTPVQTWRLANFGTTSNNGTAADTADSDGDGLFNLVEYALGKNPNLPDSAGAVTCDMLNAKLRITFPRIADPGITYRVEASSTLGNGSWTEIWQSTGAANTPGNVTVPDTQDIFTATPQHRFLRLRVTSP